MGNVDWPAVMHTSFRLKGAVEILTGIVWLGLGFWFKSKAPGLSSVGVLVCGLLAIAAGVMSMLFRLKCVQFPMVVATFVSTFAQLMVWGFLVSVGAAARHVLLYFVHSPATAPCNSEEGFVQAAARTPACRGAAPVSTEHLPFGCSALPFFPAVTREPNPFLPPSPSTLPSLPALTPAPSLLPPLSSPPLSFPLPPLSSPPPLPPFPPPPLPSAVAPSSGL